MEVRVALLRAHHLGQLAAVRHVLPGLLLDREVRLARVEGDLGAVAMASSTSLSASTTWFTSPIRPASSPLMMRPESISSSAFLRPMMCGPLSVAQVGQDGCDRSLHSATVSPSHRRHVPLVGT